jgi:NarL family two-component system response regulator LiaR
MQQTVIRVLIVDDHPMIRQGLSYMVRQEPALLLVGEASDGAEALMIAQQVRPDVVLMDFKLPKIDGIVATREILKSNPKARIIMLTSFYEPDVVNEALQAGTVGYLLKTASAGDLVHAIREAHLGRRVLAEEATNALIQAAQSTQVGASLTEREREILALIAQGLSNNAISAKLFITVPTVKFHTTNILSKLGVESRTEAVLVAIKHRLVPMPE